MLLKIPFDLSIRVDKQRRLNKQFLFEIKKVINFLSEKDLLPSGINPKHFLNYFIIEREFKKFKNIKLCSMQLSFNCDRGKIAQEIINNFNTLKNDLDKTFNITDIVIKSKHNFLVGWENLSFYVYSLNITLKEFIESEVATDLLLCGYIDKKIIEKFSRKDYPELNKELQLLGGGPIDADKESLQGMNGKIGPNFVFIRSLSDYINSAPSDSFSRAFLGISKKSPFLFDPKAEFWDDLFKEKYEKQLKTLFPLINQTRGLARTQFDKFIGYWINMIKFLRTNCMGSASNFYISSCKTLGIDYQDPVSLEKLQSLLEIYGGRVKNILGINFPWSYKAGRLFFTMMTKNLRGFDFLEGVTKKHLEHFNLPVDSQVLRVALNTGLIKVEYINAERITIGGHTANILKMRRSDMTEIVQKAWKLVAEGMDVIPIELDYAIYSIGSLVCNRFGSNCYCCPITGICDSWANKAIPEGAGVRWHSEGAFSYAKGGMDALIFRTCDESGNPNSCKETFPEINVFDEKNEKIDLKALKDKYT